jgi:anaerobic ribonucleoside-triphosphate reductase activating protein
MYSVIIYPDDLKDKRLIQYPITVTWPDEIEQEEAYTYVFDEIDLWKAKKKHLLSVTIEIDEDELVIRTDEHSPIKRVRRITGYLSEVDNFNPAKKSELSSRIMHL